MVGLTQTTNPVEQPLNHSRTSARYKHISSEKIIEILESEGFVLKNTTQANTIRKDYAGYQRHAMFFDAPFQTDSDGNTQVMVVNDHKGTTSTRFYVGYFRHACLNQLEYADDNCPCIRVSHLGDVDSKIREAIKVMKVYCQSTQALVDTLKQIKVNQSQEFKFAKLAVEELLKNTAYNDVYHFNALIIRRDEDNTGCAWALLNRVQENCLSGGINYTGPWRDHKTGVVGTKTFKTRKVNSIERKIGFNSFLFKTLRELLEV